MRFLSFERQVASLYRAVLGLLITCHGASSLFGAFGGHTISATHWPTGFAALIQLVGGAFVLVGLATRPAAVLVSGSMAYAYFDVHQRHAVMPIQNGGELAVLFCWGFLLVAMLGPGPWSLDALIARVRTGDGETRAVQPVSQEA